MTAQDQLDTRAIEMAAAAHALVMSHQENTREQFGNLRTDMRETRDMIRAGQDKLENIVKDTVEGVHHRVSDVKRQLTEQAASSATTENTRWSGAVGWVLGFMVLIVGAEAAVIANMADKMYSNTRQAVDSDNGK